MSGTNITRKYHYDVYTIDWNTVKGRDSFSIHNTKTNGIVGSSTVFNESACEIKFIEFINRFIKR